MNIFSHLKNILNTNIKNDKLQSGCFKVLRSLYLKRTSRYIKEIQEMKKVWNCGQLIAIIVCTMIIMRTEDGENID